MKKYSSYNCVLSIKQKSIIFLTIFSTGVALFASQSFTASTTGTARVEIRKQLTITAVDDLNFGEILPSTTADTTITITPAGSFTCGSGAECFGTPTSGSFEITGTKNKAISAISVDASVNLTGTGTDMPVALSTSIGSGTLDASTGKLIFNVGGELTVGTDQLEGIYSGTYTVTANY